MSWFIVTNTENLEFCLARGLLLDKQAFGNSYITDAMNDVVTGYIPCFKKGNVIKALELAVDEDKNLTQCLIEINLKKIERLSIYYRVHNPDYEPNEYLAQCDSTLLPKYDSSGKNEINEILLPAPLPFSCVKNIFVKNETAVNKIKKNLFSYHNEEMIKTNIRLFDKKKLIKHNDQKKLPFDTAEHSKKIIPFPRKIHYKKTFSYGGVLSLLYYQTKNGKKSTELFNNFYQQPEKETLPAISTYFNNKVSSGNGIEKLYEMIFDKTDGNDNGADKQAILDILKHDIEREDVPKSFKILCANLASNLEDYNNGITTKSNDEILQTINYRYKDDEDFRYFAITVTMFFMRDNTETMLKYYSDTLTEDDYCLFAMFFGSIYGFLNVPKQIKKSYELSLWVSYKMAMYCHRNCVNIGDSENRLDKEVIFSSLNTPVLIYDKYIKSSTRSCHLQKFYKELEEYMGNKFVRWNTELILKGCKVDSIDDLYNESKNISSSNTEIKHEALIDIIENFAKLIQHKIKEDKLFDINQITDMHSKAKK